MKTKQDVITELRREFTLHNLADDGQPGWLGDVVIGDKGELTAMIFTDEPVSLEELSVIIQAAGRVKWVALREWRKTQ